jgi:hypothetical protein
MIAKRSSIEKFSGPLNIVSGPEEIAIKVSSWILRWMTAPH